MDETMKMTMPTLQKDFAQVTGLLTPGSAIMGIRASAVETPGACRLS